MKIHMTYHFLLLLTALAPPWSKETTSRSLSSYLKPSSEIAWATWQLFLSKIWLFQDNCVLLKQLKKLKSARGLQTGSLVFFPHKYESPLPWEKCGSRIHGLQEQMKSWFNSGLIRYAHAYTQHKQKLCSTHRKKLILFCHINTQNSWHLWVLVK